MKPLGDRALARLRQVAAMPDLGGSRYRVVRELGRGGMGVVYLAEDGELGRQVALKVFHLDDVDEALRERLRQEARTLARLEHPNIVPVYDLGTAADGRLFYTMKYVEGLRLGEWNALPSRSLPEKLRLFERLCEAIAFSHARGLLHRDLKPANIMVGAFGECFVMDWGLAKAIGEVEAQVVGTPGYRAPEQEVAGQPASPAADIYALGRILAGMVGSEAPRPVAAIIVRAQAAAAADRYGSAEALGRDVLHYLDGLAVSAYAETRLEAAARLLRRHQVLVWLLATYVIVRTAIFLATHFR